MVVLLMLVTARHKPAAGELLDWLATVSGYIQGTMEVPGGPVVLDRWQVEGVDHGGKFAVYLKSRQVGFSFMRAAHSLAEAQLSDNYLKVLVSMNLDDAREKILYARELYETIPERFRVKLTTDNKMELGFANGSRIVTMFMPRGKGPADVDIDEMAFMARAREIFKAAMFMTLRGGRLTIGSTPLGREGLFYEIAGGAGTAAGRFRDFRLFRVPWWLSSALCRDVAQAAVEAEGLPTRERVYRFGREALIHIYENTFSEDFRQECELSFADEQEAFLPVELIFTCVDPELEVYGSLEELRGRLRGVPYAGYDVGRRKHPAELVILELLGDRFYYRFGLTMRNRDFEQQKFILRQALEVLPLARLAIDETGIGMNLAEDLAKEYPHTVLPVNFASRVESSLRRKDKQPETVAVKERMATDIRIAFERRNISIPQDRELIRQLHSVKRETSLYGNVQYSVDRNEKHHADKFWALGLALLAARPGVRPSVLVGPVFPRLRG